jgi:hypothetical protein
MAQIILRDLRPVLYPNPSVGDKMKTVAHSSIQTLTKAAALRAWRTIFERDDDKFDWVPVVGSPTEVVCTARFAPE